jgi:hypothetical protein
MAAFRMNTHILLFAVLYLSQVQICGATSLYPVDDTNRNPAFRSYVRKLKRAVDRRSLTDLRKLVDEKVVVGDDDAEKGWTSFIAKWHPEDANSNLWSVLSDFLALGFVQEHPQLFLSPYLVWRFPRELSMATHLVVIHGNAAIRDVPSSRATPFAYLVFEIVERLSHPEQKTGDLAQWVFVRTSDGRTGYLNARDVMSPLMPRAQFGISRGRWLLIALEDPGQPK